MFGDLEFLVTLNSLVRFVTIIAGSYDALSQCPKYFELFVHKTTMQA